MKGYVINEQKFYSNRYILKVSLKVVKNIINKRLNTKYLNTKSAIHHVLNLPSLSYQRIKSKSYLAPSLLYIATVSKSKFWTYIVKTLTYKSTNCIQCTIMEFRLLVLHSLRYSNMAESPNNRSAKQSLVGNLTIHGPCTY